MSSTQTILLTLTAILGAAIVVQHLTRRLRSWLPSSATVVVLGAAAFYFAGGPAWLSKTLGHTLTPVAAATKTHTAAAAPKPAVVHAPSAPDSGSWVPSWLTLNSALSVLGLILTAVILIMVVKVAAGRRKQASLAAGQREHDQELWDNLVATDLDTVRRWTDYQQDLALLLQFPMMQDRGEPAVAKAISAMAAAESLRSTVMPDLKGTPVKDSDYARAVTTASAALDLAESRARRSRLSGYDLSAQQKIRGAQQHLAVALGAAQLSEIRRAEFAQVRDLLDGLVVVPAGALI